ncbi:hypothetical protein KRX57_01010 [Weeksellaceae bacterium TAE3-ERU29]|nr:hypothetical protein [Weeksellaceae bacterium TAE3-ERU29]
MSVNVSRKEIKVLQKKVKVRFDDSINSTKKLEELAGEIGISYQTLRRFFNKIDKGSKLRESSLNFICKYVGYSDWEDFVHQQGNLKQKEKLVDIINGSVPFFSKLNEYDMGVFSTPGIWDTINDYSLIFFKNEETIQYGYKTLKPYPKACEILFSINPCYNYCTKKWYRKIWKEILNTDVEVDVKVSMNSFLAYSAFLSTEYDLALQYIKEAEKYVESMREKYLHFVFPEMRYCIAQLIKLKIENNSTFFFQPIKELLESINKNITDEKEYAEFSSKIYIANALVWLGEFNLANELLDSKMYKIAQEFNWTFSNNYIDSSYVLLEPTVNLINSILDTKISSDTKFQNTHSFNLKKDYIHLHNLIYQMGQLQHGNTEKKHSLQKEIESYIEQTGFKQAYNVMKYFL